MNRNKATMWVGITTIVGIFVCVICMTLFGDGRSNNVEDEAIQRLADNNEWYRYKVVEECKLPDYMFYFKDLENELNIVKTEYEMGDSTKLDENFKKMGLLLKDMSSVIDHMNLNFNGNSNVNLSIGYGKTVNGLVVDVVYFDGDNKQTFKEIVLCYGSKGTNLYTITDLIEEYSDIYQTFCGFYENIEGGTCPH